jgi:hypothetical protein
MQPICGIGEGFFVVINKLLVSLEKGEKTFLLIKNCLNLF